MGIIKIDLNPRYNRPVIAIETNKGLINAIIDTGATKAVWNSSESYFMEKLLF